MQFSKSIFPLYLTLTSNCFIGESASRKVLKDRWSKRL